MPPPPGSTWSAGTSNRLRSNSATISLTVTVENRGSADGEYPAQLTANGDAVVSDTLPIAAGDSSTLTLGFTPDEAGEYELVVGDVDLGTVIVSEDTISQGGDGEETDEPEAQAADEPESGETDTPGSGTLQVVGLVILLTAIAGGAVVLRTIRRR
ncbi:MAG: CARDB domain-containing protein [Natrialbaceae archaeon]|nr:CARDB domain-containing protein [Natrialbaceae archaeon]